MTGAVEELHFKLRFEIANRMADRRLHSRQPHRRRAEAAGLGDGDENAHLIERQAVQHVRFL